MHDEGFGLGFTPLHEIVRSLNHTNTVIAVMLVDCSGCEIRDLSDELTTCRKLANTNFTQVIVTITPSLASVLAWERGLFYPMHRLGYTQVYSESIGGRGIDTEQVCFHLFPHNHSIET